MNIGDDHVNGGEQSGWHNNVKVEQMAKKKIIGDDSAEIEKKKKLKRMYWKKRRRMESWNLIIED